MVRAGILRRSQWCWLAAGFSSLISGCSYFEAYRHDYDPLMPPPPASAAPPMIGSHVEKTVPLTQSEIQTVAFNETVPALLPAPAVAAAHDVSVNLDIVLKMTEERNAQIALARKRVEETAAAECEGHSCQLTQLMHHSAGTCDTEEDANCNTHGGLFANLGANQRLTAEAKTWQRKAELARTTNETLLDAGNTYIDLLTARRTESIGRELEKYQKNLLRRAEDLAKSERSATVLVENLRAELSGRHALQAKLHQQGDAAMAKLAYLLNLPPDSPIIPLDTTLEPFDRVDISPSATDLVARAQAEGPGVAELTGLMATLQEGISRVRPCLARLPKVAQQLQTAQYKLEETQLALDDLRGKLAAGVLEAREAILSGREQITDGTEQIRHAAETYRLTDLRLKQNAPGASTGDVSQSVRGLELAHFNYISAIAAYDKAQLRLQLLLRDGGACSSPLPSQH